MGLFNRNRVSEPLYKYNGYVIGQASHVIYHVPESPYNDIFMLPEGTTGLSETAIMELRKYKAKTIVVPASFKKFNVQFLNFENLEMIKLNEGIEEVKCSFDNKRTVDIVLPSTIKRIGRGSYPIVKELILPNSVVEIEKMFASHDTNLVYVNIPGTVKTIPESAFNQCKNLQRVILNEGVETAMLDSFRGTNSLRSLVLPSTFNGTIALSMDPRGTTNARGNSKYDPKRFEEDQNAILSIRITRGNKVFEFNMKRKEQPTLAIRRNIIKISCSSQQQMISIDANRLQSGTYSIENGTLIPEQEPISQKTEEKNEAYPQNKNGTQNDIQDRMDRLDAIFQNAYRDNITGRDDFVGLSNADKMKIKKAMRTLFFQIVEQFGTVNTDYGTFDYLYNRVLKEIKLDATLQDNETTTDFGSSGMKR